MTPVIVVLFSCAVLVQSFYDQYRTYLGQIAIVMKLFLCSSKTYYNIIYKIYINPGRGSQSNSKPKLWSIARQKYRHCMQFELFVERYQSIRKIYGINRSVTRLILLIIRLYMLVSDIFKKIKLIQYNKACCELKPTRKYIAIEPMHLFGQMISCS